MIKRPVFDGGRAFKVDDAAHVGLVDTEAEGDGTHHHAAVGVAPHEALLRAPVALSQREW